MSGDRYPRRVRCLGTGYALVKVRYGGGATYAADDRSTYLRMGPGDAVRAEADAGRWMARHGYPVAPIVAHGTLGGDRAFVVERSLGDRTYGEEFAAAFPAAVGPDLVTGYGRVVLAHLAAQMGSPRPPGVMAIDDLVRMPAVARHDPPGPRVVAAYHRAAERVSALPVRLSNADLTPYNVLPGGIIDLELACLAPLGYDVVTSVYFGRFWPDGLLAYRIDDDVVDGHLQEVEDLVTAAGHPGVLRHVDDFLMLKTVWATGRDAVHDADPGLDADLWAWRSRVREWASQEYLAGRRVDTTRFAEVGAP